MEEIILTKPALEHEQKAEEYIKEFINNNSQINGTGGLDRYIGKYKEWLLKLEADLDIANIPEGRVPATTMFAIRVLDGKIIGMINIRHRLNDYLAREGGHVGYSVRPSERRKGYATILLNLGLQESQNIGLEKVLVTCDTDNIGSAKTIQNNGGILEKEIIEEGTGTSMQRYWIDVNYVIGNRKSNETNKIL